MTGTSRTPARQAALPMGDTPDRTRARALIGAVLLHAAVFVSLAELNARAVDATPRGASVRINLVSAGPAKAPEGASADPSAPLSTPLSDLAQALSETSSMAAASPEAATIRGSIDELMMRSPGGKPPAPRGALQKAGAGGTSDRDPYARASLSADAGRAAPEYELRAQVMACAMEGGTRKPVTVQVELTANGALNRAPKVLSPGRTGAERAAEAAAIQLVRECAPYQLGGQRGVFLIVVG